MGILNKISNRHLLVGLVGLGLLNALLCLLYMMRESSNATEIAKLSEDLKLASDKHHNRAKDLAYELDKTRDELFQAKRLLSRTTEKLEAMQSDLEMTRTTLATYQDKPWLAKSGKTAPWANSVSILAERLSLVEKTLRDNNLVPSANRKE